MWGDGVVGFVWKSDTATRVVIFDDGLPVVALRLPQAMRVSSPCRLRYDCATRVSPSCVAAAPWYSTTLEWFVGQSDTATRVVIIIRWFTCGGASLTTGYACIVALQAPIRPRYAGLTIVGGRFVGSGATGVGMIVENIQGEYF